MNYGWENSYLLFQQNVFKMILVMDNLMELIMKKLFNTLNQFRIKKRKNLKINVKKIRQKLRKKI
jgi:hypothetical protein